MIDGPKGTARVGCRRWIREVYCSFRSDISRNIVLAAVKLEGAIAYLLTNQPTTNGKTS